MTARHNILALLPLAALAGILSLSVALASAPQTTSPPKPKSGTDSSVLVQVTGEVPQPLALSGGDLAKLPRQEIRAKRHDGVESQFAGVPLVEILAKAGAPIGKELRGPAMALYLVVEAADGYRAVFALSELDPAFTDRVVLLADRRDGQPLSMRDGPLQVVVPGEKKHARWVRQVIRLRVGRA